MSSEDEAAIGEQLGSQSSVDVSEEPVSTKGGSKSASNAQKVGGARQKNKAASSAGSKASSAGSKAKKDWKFCLGCGKPRPRSDFYVGAQLCKPNTTAHDLLRKAAVAQGKEEWWIDVKADSERFQAAVAWYHEQNPPPMLGEKKKRPKMPVLTNFVEKAYEDRSAIRDGVDEMMSLLAFQDWAAKPKNGGMDADDAKAEWEAECLKQPARD